MLPAGRGDSAMTFEAYYGEALSQLRRMEQDLLSLLKQYPARRALEDVQPILYCKSRIKEPGSTIRKLESRGFSTDAQTGLRELHDILGIRIVCSFMDDVYEISQWLHDRKEIQIIAEKDYIAYPKPNGYRSLHLILRFANGTGDEPMAEIQLRTIAIDSWAALEHQIKYKRQIQYEKIIQDELKRCADEIASVDMSMQALRDILWENKWI